MGRGFVIAVTILVASLLASGGAPAQTAPIRLALVIANAQYSSEQLIDLPGAERDAVAIAGALQQAGFDGRNIVVERNLDLAGMRRALSQFGARLAALGQGGVGFVYYAGHGIADSDGEGARNYIIPVDAEISSAFDYPNAAYSVSGLLDGLNRTRARTVIVVLDACRRTPLRGDRGMVPEAAPTNMLVAYSASPGQSASDDGLYARRLAEELVRPNVEITQVFRQVQYRVSADTRNAQRPRMDDGLTEPVMLSAVEGAVVSDFRPQSVEPQASAVSSPAIPPSIVETRPTAGLANMIGRWSLIAGGGCANWDGLTIRSLTQQGIAFDLPNLWGGANEQAEVRSSTTNSVNFGWRANNVTLRMLGVDQLELRIAGAMACQYRRNG